jgi:N-acetylmuramic acid 6-phosphate (MurNAc-6-P) etherase
VEAYSVMPELGRLGVVDASECPPTLVFLILVIGIIAGGDRSAEQAIDYTPSLERFARTQYN